MVQLNDLQGLVEALAPKISLKPLTAIHYRYIKEFPLNVSISQLCICQGVTRTP